MRKVKKEQSKTKDEFLRIVSRKSTPKKASPAKAKSHPAIKLDNLPVEVIEYLEASKKRYPTVSTQNGSSYVGEMAFSRQHGFGFCQAQNLAYYFGNWVEGKR